MNAGRPAVWRSSCGLDDAVAECPGSGVAGGCCAACWGAALFGTWVLSRRREVVR